MNKDKDPSSLLGGGSRAAKKRAKKRLKEQDPDVIMEQPQQQNLLNIPPVQQHANHPPVVAPNPKRVKRKEDKESTKSIPAKLLHTNVLDFLKPFIPSSSNTNTTSTSTDLSNILLEDYARLFFEFLLSPSPISAKEFYRYYWEKKPLLISMEENLAGDDDDEDDEEDDVEDDDYKTDTKKMKQKENHLSLLKDHFKTNATQKLEYEKRYESILSQHDFHTALNAPWNGKDISISNYNPNDDNDDDDDEDRNEIQNPNSNINHPSKSAKDVWSQYKDKGCTIRLCNPQTYNDKTYAIQSLLENEFGCRMEAHVDLTPGGMTPNQGYAPHYDNTEAFILQLEGRKHWRVYSPLSIAETLPREEGESTPLLHDRKPVIDVELGPGDLLYIPRGWIHQANTLHGGTHALHLSIHTMRNWAWCDFLELLIPDALEAATASDSSTLLRQGLPRNFLHYMGVMHEYRDDQDFPEGLKQVAQSLDQDDSSHLAGDQEKVEEIQQMKLLQDEFKAEAKKRIMRVCREALDMITAGCDQMAKRFISERLPPILTRQETQKLKEGTKIRAQSMVRCIRKGIARIVLEDGKAILYHCMDNARECQAQPLSPLEFEVDDGPALEALLTTTAPQWMCVQDLNHGMIEDKIEIAQALFDEGLLELHHV